MISDRQNTLPAAVIVGMEANGLGVSRALSSFNIRCIGIDAQKRNPVRYTNSCKVIACGEWDSTHLINLLITIGSQSSEKMALLLTKDEAVIWVSEAREQLSQYFFLNLPSVETVNLLMSKVNFLKVASEKGWPVPKTAFASSSDEIREKLSEIIFPCILKPAIKNSEFRKYASAKAYIANTAEELLSHYASFSIWENDVVIQELIAGEDDRIAFCLAYYDRTGNALAAFPGRKLSQYPRGCGNTAIAAPAPDEWVNQILEISRTIFDTVGFRGLGSIEYKVDKTGACFIMEPTVGRTNWQSEVAVINGTNIPLIAYCDLTGVDLVKFARRENSLPCKLVDNRAHYRLLRTHYDKDSASLKLWANQRAGRKKYMLWRLNDPLPFIVVYVFKIAVTLKKAARFIIKRKHQ